MAATVAPMTFLQLVQRLHVESGTSGAAQSTTSSATGEWQRLCNYISNAYVELQNHREDWLWMEQDVQFDTVSGQQSYPYDSTVFTTPVGTGISDFASWKLSSVNGDNSFRLWLTSAGVNNESFLSSDRDYDSFRDFYIFGASRNVTARPISICVGPALDLLLGYIPNDIYTVVGKYHQAPTLFDDDADVPAIPARYHMLIVWMALEQYGLYEPAPEVIVKAQENGKPLLRKLEDTQLEEMQLPDPLV
jgi:hypothetical protein